MNYIQDGDGNRYYRLPRADANIADTLFDRGLNPQDGNDRSIVTQREALRMRAVIDTQAMVQRIEQTRRMRVFIERTRTYTRILVIIRAVLIILSIVMLYSESINGIVNLSALNIMSSDALMAVLP